jgi:hypothetical protein
MYRRYRGLEHGYHYVIVLFPSRTGDRGHRAAGLCGQDWGSRIPFLLRNGHGRTADIISPAHQSISQEATGGLFSAGSTASMCRWEGSSTSPSPLPLLWLMVRL